MYVTHVTSMFGLSPGLAYYTQIFPYYAFEQFSAYYAHIIMLSKSRL